MEFFKAIYNAIVGIFDSFVTGSEGTKILESIKGAFNDLFNKDAQ